MKPVFAFTLASVVAASLSQRLPAQHDIGAALTHVVPTEDRKDNQDSISFHSVSAGRERAESIPRTDTKGRSISLVQIGSTAEKQYCGDRLSVCATEAVARLRCVFQKLEGEATSEGLWLTSTVTNASLSPTRGRGPA